MNYFVKCITLQICGLGCYNLIYRAVLYIKKKHNFLHCYVFVLFHYPTVNSFDFTYLVINLPIVKRKVEISLNLISTLFAFQLHKVERQSKKKRKPFFNTFSIKRT